MGRGVFRSDAKPPRERWRAHDLITRTVGTDASASLYALEPAIALDRRQINLRWITAKLKT